MTFQLHHDWIPGATILGAELANCAHCGTLLVIEAGKTTFIRRKLDPERIVEAEPPCVSPGRFEAPW